MIIKTIEVRDLPEYKEIIKKTAFNQAKDIIKGVWPELANNMAIYTPNSQEDTERVSANQRQPEIVTTGEDQIRHLREDTVQHLTENITQETLTAFTPTYNGNVVATYRENNNATDTIRCSNEDNIRPRHLNREGAGAIYFNTSNHTLNIFDGQNWYSMQAYRNDGIYIPYEMDFRTYD